MTRHATTARAARSAVTRDARDTRRMPTDGKRCWKTATRLAWRKRAESAVMSAGKNFRKRCKKEVNNAVDRSGQANAA